MAGRRGAAVDDTDVDDVDHYAALGLSSDAGPKLSPKEIEKAYKAQSLARHPDKRPDDPNAKADFQRLRSSFEVLRDPVARAAFDARLLARAEAASRDLLRSEKRRRAMSDLDERERAAAREEDGRLAQESRDKRVAEELQREILELRQRLFTKSAIHPVHDYQMSGKEKSKEKKEPNEEDERTLKVSWDKGGGDYSFLRLKELFERFGVVEDLVMRQSEKKRSRGSAVVVMATKDAADAATQVMSGDIENPLLVLPLKPRPLGSSNFCHADMDSKVSKLVGSGFHDYEASVLEKLKKAKRKGC